MGGATDAWARLRDGRLTEPTLLLADGVPSDYGETDLLGTRYLKNLRPELYRWD